MSEKLNSQLRIFSMWYWPGHGMGTLCTSIDWKLGVDWVIFDFLPINMQMVVSVPLSEVPALPRRGVSGLALFSADAGRCLELLISILELNSQGWAMEKIWTTIRKIFFQRLQMICRFWDCLVLRQGHLSQSWEQLEPQRPAPWCALNLHKLWRYF